MIITEPFFAKCAAEIADEKNKDTKDNHRRKPYLAPGFGPTDTQPDGSPKTESLTSRYHSATRTDPLHWLKAMIRIAEDKGDTTGDRVRLLAGSA